MSDGLNPDIVKMMHDGFREIRNQLAASEGKASESRRIMHQNQHQASLALQDLQHRMTAIEGEFAAAKPTLSEFHEIKAQVRGARKFGRWLWAVGTLLLAAAAWLTIKWDAIAGAWRALSGK